MPEVYEVIGLDFLEHQTEKTLYMSYFIEEYEKEMVKEYDLKYRN